VVLLRALKLFSSLALATIVLFAIVAPLASILQASGVDGRVYVVTPRSFTDWLERQGYSMGSLIVAMMSPLDYESYSFWAKDVAGERLDLDFRRVARSWEEFYQSDVGRRVLKTSPPIPTISITITLSREEGGDVLECVAQYTYSTIDYFVEKGLPVEKAVEATGKDPLAHLRKPLTITLKPRMPKSEIKITCFDLSPVLERLKEAMDREVGLTTTGYVLTEATRIEVAQSCPEFTEVWWTSLYDSRNTPPQGWYNNIYSERGETIPDSEKLGVWNFYADKYSRAYYWPTTRYSNVTAKQATLAMLGLTSENLYSMDGWIYRMFQHLYGRTGVRWKDYNENYGYANTYWTGYAPYIGVYMENPYGKSFAAYGGLSVAHFMYYKKGIAVAGVIFVGNEVLSKVHNAEPVSVSTHGSRSYVTAWTGYYYIRDGLILQLDVKRVTRGSCEYWRVIPATTIMPIHDVVVDWRYMMEVRGRDPDFYRSILYSTSIDTVYNRYLVNVPRGTIVYSEPSLKVATRVSNPTLASLLFNLLLEAVELTIIENLVCQGGALCRFFLSMIGGLLNYVNEDLESIAVIFDFNVATGNDVSSAFLRIDKITLKTTNAYSSIGWRPLMVEYRVYIDSNPDPPPCDYPYCPYGGGGG
jgi:hypothetical protein